MKTPQIIINEELTKTELGTGPHTKVYVKCQDCDETFIREIENINQLHNCVTKFYQWRLSSESRPTRVECRIINPNGRIPSRNRHTDAGYDLYSSEDITIPACVLQYSNIIEIGHQQIHTGIQISVPQGHYYTIECRSGLSLKYLIPVRNIIDTAYSGEIVVNMLNYTHTPHTVKCGDRIAQIIYHTSVDIDLTVVDEFSADYNIRGDNGFGSSGT